MHIAGQFQNKILTEYLTKIKLEECDELKDEDSNYRVYKDKNSNEIHVYEKSKCELPQTNLSNNDLDQYRICFSNDPKDKDTPKFVSNNGLKKYNSNSDKIKYNEATNEYEPVNNEVKKYIILNTIEYEQSILNLEQENKELAESQINFSNEKLENENLTGDELEFVKEYKKIGLSLYDQHCRESKIRKHHIDLLNKMLEEIK